ncbi:DUF2306 domain-containing protein [Hyphomonas sp.]|uniref:DUF2306 domain-containing protein n=1 Tax=Hyphomonas sp. TaxID=87 RepID=UPI003D2C4767
MPEPALVGMLHFHVGCAAVVAGFAALAARKGEATHRAAGKIFLLAMLVLTLSGLWMSISREILFTVFLSAIALHAFVTGWAAAALQRRIARTITQASGFSAGAMTTGAILGGLKAAGTTGGALNGLPPAAFYLIAGIGCLLCYYDLVFCLTRTPSDQRRITRHAWRLGFSFFLATGIFFFGNNHVLPAALRTPLFLSMPVVAVVICTFYHALRTRLSRDVAFRRRRPFSGGQ